MTRPLTARLGATVAAAAALALAGGTAAHASVNTWGPGTLASGAEVCVSAAATSDARGIGSASPPGVVFRLFRNGTQISPDNPRQNSFDQYTAGAGTYKLCAKNALGLGTPVANVVITLLTDADA
jgi:hypothetical protein